MTKRIFLSFLASVSHGLLLAWALTLERSSSNLMFGSLSIIGLLLFFHLLSSSVLKRSVLIITSYPEGIFFFTMTMAAFRIGDHYFDITDISLRTEFFLIITAVLFGAAYVWMMRRISKMSLGRD